MRNMKSMKEDINALNREISLPKQALTSRSTPEQSLKFRSFLHALHVLHGRILFCLLVLWGAPTVLAQDRETKLIEFGWDTPVPVEAAKKIDAMQKVPFDGIAFQLTANGEHSIATESGRKKSFNYRSWSQTELSETEFSETIEAIKTIQWGRYTDNFACFWTKPGDVDWFSDKFSSVLHNAALLARIAKTGGLKGILLDTELYPGLPFPPWKYNPKNEGNRSFEEYQQQVRLRGREFMQAINQEYPDITILITFGYYQAFLYMKKDVSLSTIGYGLLPSFLDGMLEAASEKTMIYDGWEQSYGGANFAKVHAQVTTEGPEKWTAVPDKYRQHYHSSFGLWLDLDWNGFKWDPKNVARNYYTPEGFASTVNSALQQTDRYVWIWSQQIVRHGGWWGGEMPLYVDALAQARGDASKLYGYDDDILDYFDHITHAKKPFVTLYQGKKETPAAKANLEVCPNDFKSGAASIQVNWTAPSETTASGGFRRTVSPQGCAGNRYTIWVKSLTPDTVGEIYVEFAAGDNFRLAERHVWTNVPTEWTQLNIVLGEQGDAARIEKGASNVTGFDTILFAGTTREPGQTASLLWDELRRAGGSK